MTITDRIDSITEIPEKWKHTVLPAPPAVKIELTARCNFSCAYCARSQKLREQGDMDWDLFVKIAADMRNSGVEELGLFYLGESMLYPHLVDAIEFAKKTLQYPYVFLTTNGSVSWPAKLEACFRAGLDSLKFSFNYADAQQFADIARVKKALWHRVIANMIAARDIRDRVEAETGHRCGLYASYIAYDGLQGERMREAVATVEPYMDEIYALPLYHQAKFAETVERDTGYVPTQGNRGRIGALRDPLPCWAVFREGHVTFDGKLSACCFDHDGRFAMGDLTQSEFMDAWNSERFQDLRSAHLVKDITETPCANCVAWS